MPGKDRRVDIDVQFLGKELRERPVGEVRHKRVAHLEQLVQEHHADGADVA